MKKGSRKAVRPKSTMEQSSARGLNPSLDPSPTEKARYELATFRAARKTTQAGNIRKAGVKRGPAPGGR